ncbi:hypothetical protein [Helicobacter colisuis]|uniref:hypothetical protein n=1 Tax=Helicobacter colisuis TaxID=2949739 RepID=UPI002029E2BA|nr:hypothetical protein [Helicobacter colisuis]MCL9822262.1 hypothetical protein [Helicobacter colisuis]
MKSTFLKPLILSFCATALSSYLYADTFVKFRPKPKLQITPLDNFDKSLQREMQKYPKGTAFMVDARTGKIVATTPQRKQTPKPQVPKPPKKEKTPPYHINEEYIELL